MIFIFSYYGNFCPQCRAVNIDRFLIFTEFIIIQTITPDYSIFCRTAVSECAMGNESSLPGGLDISDKAVEITDFWSVHNAYIRDTTKCTFTLKGHTSVSVFKNEVPVLGAMWSSHSPIEKCAINLMKYRHPFILRYLCHWQQRGINFLATESVQPLSQVLGRLDSLQICVGLNQILQALDFLHSKASLSHNNVCMSSVYVLPDGCWRLGGMEFVRSFSEMNSSYLKQSSKYRYDKGIDPNEDTIDDVKKVDQYAFAILVEEVFRGRNEGEVPQLKDFKTSCNQQLKNPKASLRPSFSNLLEHRFFNHEFISIHSFLSSLPLKTEPEKSLFFDSLVDKLKIFNEETAAQQLGTLLLSRMVLLDNTAKEKLLPFLLTPKQDNSDDGLFSLDVFKNHLSPQLLKMFCVRDTQVRTLLLKHFSSFVSTFSKEDLTIHILPELLLGIKDTSDSLVSMTLHCLADLVPILGATTVIGGKRTRLFTDGRPMAHNHKTRRESMIKPKQVPQVESTPIPILPRIPSVESVEVENPIYLHERPSPDGGEDLQDELPQISNPDVEIEGSDENWSDWVENDPPANKSEIIEEEDTKPELEISVSSHSSQFYLQKAAKEAKFKKLTDISELDIKNQKFDVRKNSSGNEFDFFTDMEPVIEKVSVYSVEKTPTAPNADISSKLNFMEDNEETGGDGGGAWGDADWEEDD